MSRRYYEAYEDRYRQVHSRNLQWSSSQPTPIVEQIMDACSIGKADTILELGCGEGRDAAWLLNKGFRVLATDISEEAIAHCRRMMPAYSESFQVLDCINGELNGKFRFLYAVAVLHMLLTDEDRDGFYRFIREHLSADGIALICTMGDGEREFASDVSNAFTLQQRQHQGTGEMLMIAGTSCRMVSFGTFFQELERNGLLPLQQGITHATPDFDQLMYAVVKRI